MRKNIDSLDDFSQRDRIDLRDTIKKYSYYWKFFLIGVALALALAFAYLKFATYEYEVSSTILINDEDNDGGSTSEISVFQDLGLFAGPKTSIDTEIGILKSKSIIERVVKDLGLNIRYFVKNGLVTKEIYKDQMPFKIHFLLNDQGLNNLNSSFTIKSISDNKYELFDSNGNKISTGGFGEKMSWDFGDIIVTPNQIENKEQSEILIKISPLEEVAIAFKKRIEITAENPKSNLLILKLQDPIKQKAIEVLDSLVWYYNQDAINYKNLIAKNTNEFLNSRIDDVSAELTGLDQGVETYKSENQLSNIDYESNITLASNASLTKQIAELNSQIKLIDYLIDYMSTNKDDLIPDNLGMLDDNMNQNAIKYNNLLLDRNRILKGANSENPIVLNLNDQIKSLRESIDRSLINQRSSLRITLNEARRQEEKLNSQIYSTPKKEREIKVITRQQEIIETLYLYLLQKREENSISAAVSAPYAIIIDKAYGSSVPVAPRKTIVLITSLLLGFLIPAFIIMLKALFNNKINTYDDIKSNVNAPLIGDIPKANTKKGIISFGTKKNDHIVESFRLLRTNIIHQLSGGNKNRHTIFVTSTICEEGKTFISTNLATSFALLNKKVLLIEANIRNPKISNYLKLKSENGLFHFLTDKNLKAIDVITQYKDQNFDIIDAGEKIGKSSEVLNSDRFEELINYGKNNYDYVIVETPAVNTDSDTLMQADHADLFLYVVRVNYLTERLLNVPKTLYESNRLPNMNILMNAIDYNKLGYDNGSVKKSLWKRVFR
ncbi:GumC family protein [Winogradskyella schleiferi]|uniref:GumC family protein n=1 Tax=Winogradskyella schleiferi TaxID=2686078 RepID=UPI0015B9DF95|nr:tyrosine-protein kinase family protein [Winogradskyella schleiferi]